MRHSSRHLSSEGQKGSNILSAAERAREFAPSSPRHIAHYSIALKLKSLAETSENRRFRHSISKCITFWYPCDVLLQILQLIPWRTSPNTSKLRPEFSRCTATTLFLTVVVPVTSGCAVCAISTSCSRCADAGGTGWTRGFFVGCGNDLGGEMQPYPSNQPIIRSNNHIQRETHHSRRNSTPSGVSV